MFIAETWMEHLARTLSIDRHDLIRRNLLRAVPDSMTYFGQAVRLCRSDMRPSWSDPIADPRLSFDSDVERPDACGRRRKPPCRLCTYIRI